MVGETASSMDIYIIDDDYAAEVLASISEIVAGASSE